MHICKHFKQLWITLSHLPVWFYINYSSTAQESPVNTQHAQSYTETHTWCRNIGSEAAIWLCAPPAPSPAHRCTLIKPASKPPVPSATWVSHHLERARDEPPLSRALTAIQYRQLKALSHFLKIYETFPDPERVLIRYYMWEGVIWFFGSARSVIYVSLCHIFRKTTRATKV